jgi:hypothetical protein
MLSAAVLVAARGPSASAGPPKLKGDYGFTGSTNCITAGAFTEDNTFETLSTGFITGEDVQGVRTFNNDGKTGNVTGFSMSVERIGGTSTTGNASSSTFSFSFSYTVGSGNTFTSSTVGLVSGKVTSGPRAGQTFTHDQGTAYGQISQNAEVLTTAARTPFEQTVTYSNGDVGHRICTSSRVHIRL